MLSKYVTDKQVKNECVPICISNEQIKWNISQQSAMILACVVLVYVYVCMFLSVHVLQCKTVKQ